MIEPAANSEKSNAAPVTQRYLKVLNKTQLMQPQMMRAYQFGLLEKLVRHARAHVPFYRDTGRLEPLFRRDDTIDWDRWREIPPLTRGEVQTAASNLHTELLPQGHGASTPFSTSGSTGQPVKVLHSDLCGCAWIAQMLRILKRHAIDPTRRIVSISNFSIDEMDSAGMHRADAWYPGFGALGIRGERIRLINSRPVNELLDAVLQLRPRYVHLQPVLLELMCATDTDRKLNKIGIDKIITVGEHLGDTTKRAATECIGCEVVDIYASNECGLIASTCAECGNYHIEAECHFVEILATSGMPVDPGETGTVMVTPLCNYAMPLIRYEHADKATLGRPEGCRLKLPELSAILGKEFVPFIFRGGVAVRPIIPVKAIVEFLGAKAFRVVQVSDDRCVISLVPGSLRPEKMRFDAVTELLRRMWWSELQVDYRIVESLLTATPGKIKLYDRQIYHKQHTVDGMWG